MHYVGQTWLHDYLKPAILLILFICIRNPHGPNFDPVWIIYLEWFCKDKIIISRKWLKTNWKSEHKNIFVVQGTRYATFKGHVNTYPSYTRWNAFYQNNVFLLRVITVLRSWMRPTISKTMIVLKKTHALPMLSIYDILLLPN